MTVVANFEEKYRFSSDPWQALDPERSGYYRWLIDAAVRFKPAEKPRLLDIGSGEGFLTAQIAQGLDAGAAVGVDVAETAVGRARLAYPELSFTVADFGRTISDLGKFDIITCSQVIYYLRPAQLTTFFQNIYSSLADGGIAVITATCPGGDYFEPGEFQAICAGAFEMLHTAQHGDHQLFVGRKRPCDVVVTIDYEMYYPVQRLSMDQWDKQVFEPTTAMLSACDEVGARLTIFVEMGQYHFLERHAPEISARMKAQLVQAVRGGHDVQVHLHTRWHPDCGANLRPDGTVALADNVLRIHEIPAEKLRPLLGRLKSDLETLLRPARDDYRADCFRAGKYQIQPTDLILPALRDAGYVCDSSVWHNGYLPAYDGKPGFDFRSLWHPTKPYWPGARNINRQVARPQSPNILEIPVLAAETQWSLDMLDVHALVDMFDRHTAGGRARVMIGHSYAPKRDRIEQLGAALKLLAQRGARFSSLGEQARLLREDPVLRDELGALASYGARARIAPEELWQRIGTQRQRTLQLIAGRLDALKPRGEPLRIADVGCGTGELVTFPLLYLLRDRPVEMHGVDTDAASIERAWEGAASYGLEGRVAFQSGSADQLKGMFDAVICAHVLDRVDDPPALLRDASALVAPEGLLLVVSANGASYSHRERRLVTGLYNFILRQPMAVRHAAVRIKRLLGALRRRPQTGPVARAPLGTLNFASEEVVSPLSKGRLLRLLGQAGLAPVAIENLAALGGILGRRLDHLAGWAGNPSKLPSALASEWLVIARRKNP